MSMAALCTSAQDFDDYQPIIEEEQQEKFHEPETDTELFMQPLGGSGELFENITRYRTAAIRYDRRGLDEFGIPTEVTDFDLRSITTRRYDYQLTGHLRKMSGRRQTYAGASQGWSWVGGSRRLDVSPLNMSRGHRASIQTSDRSERLGFRYDGVWRPSENWGLRLFAERGFGHDAHIDGVFRDMGAVTLAASGNLKKGASLEIMASTVASERGLRSYATKEAFELTSNNLYNPSWGWQNGSKRNSRVGRDLSPMIAVALSVRAGKNTTARFSAGFRYSSKGYTAPAWWNAPNPYPDYYRYMPSYWNPESLQNREALDLWLSGDPSVTQVDWSRLSQTNVNSGNLGAGYIIENRVSRTSNAQLAADFTTTKDDVWMFCYGIRLTSENNRNFKVAHDMLGITALPDSDPFLDNRPSDLRNPGRTITDGKRFGYDYAIGAAEARTYARVVYMQRDYRIHGELRIGAHGFSRNGFYEKGDGSYGRSQTFMYAPVAGSAGCEWYLNPGQSLLVTAMAAAEPPAPGSVFLSPQFYNAAADNGMEKTYAAEVAYRYSVGNMLFNITGFAIASTNESRIYRYWDDLSAQYCDFAMRGIDKRRIGIEAASTYRLSNSFTADAALSVGRYTYTSDPAADIVTDDGQEIVATGLTSRLSGLKLPSSPEVVATGGIGYRHRKGLWANLWAVCMGGRHLEAEPLRHTQRIEGSFGQESLPDAVALNLSIYKIFRTRFGSIDIFAALNNILNSDIIYNGYQQMRFSATQTGGTTTYAPYASKFLYSYPRHYYLRLTCKF